VSRPPDRIQCGIRFYEVSKADVYPFVILRLLSPRGQLYNIRVIGSKKSGVALTEVLPHPSGTTLQI